MRPLLESVAATTAAAIEDDAMDVAGDTAEADTTLEETTMLFDDGMTIVVVEDIAATATAAAAVATAAMPAVADAVAALLRPLLREPDRGAVAGVAGGGKLLTKGLLLSRSARR